MKSIQTQKDSRITNISLNNFTGSICIITSLFNNDKQTKNLMLSSSQPNSTNNLFKPHHHLSLITQPILGARSRRKDKTNNSLIHNHRNSFNDSSSLISSVNQTDKFHIEKKNSIQESLDSGLDFSLSTESSGHYPQSYSIIHRPLSALNEDSTIDDDFHGYENENSSSNQQQKSHEDLHRENRTNINIHRLSNDSIFKTNKSSLKKLNKFNSIIETKTYLHTNNSNQSLKPKSITPLGHYPNPEQIRAHINRSVIERQHPSYLPNVSQQQNIILTKADQILSRQIKQPLNIFRSNLNTHRIISQSIKPISINVHHEEKRFNEQNKIQQTSIRMKSKDISKHNTRINHIDNFQTSTPRHPFQYQSFKHNRSIGGHIKGPLTNQRLQETGLIVQSKPISHHRKNEYSNMNSKNYLHLPQIEYQQEKSPMNSYNTSPRIQHSRQQNDFNRIFHNRSPTSWTVICEHQNHPSPCSSSSHHENFITGETFRLTPLNEQELHNEQQIIPDIVLFKKFVDDASQTSSLQTQPFTCFNDFNFPLIQHQSNINENFIEIPTDSSASIDCLPVNDQFRLPSEKAIIHIENDDLSTNYDSDDGWSNDSAEVIYTDERYMTQENRNISPLNSIQ